MGPMTAHVTLADVAAGCSSGYPNYGSCSESGILPFTGSDGALAIAGVGAAVLIVGALLVIGALWRKWQASR